MVKMKKSFKDKLTIAVFIIAAVAVVSAVVYFGETSYSLTGSNIYVKVMTPCAEPNPNAMIYEYFDTYYSQPAEYFRWENNDGAILGTESVFAIRPSSDLATKGVYVCEGDFMYNINDEPVRYYDFLHDSRYPQPNDYVKRLDETGEVKCQWISKNTLLTQGTSPTNPIQVTLGSCLPPECYVGDDCEENEKCIEGGCVEFQCQLGKSCMNKAVSWQVMEDHTCKTYTEQVDCCVISDCPDISVSNSESVMKGCSDNTCEYDFTCYDGYVKNMQEMRCDLPGGTTGLLIIAGENSSLIGIIIVVVMLSAVTILFVKRRKSQ
jgi:hypothetical protein